MPDPTLTREAWRRLTLSATGLTALAFTVDDMIGLAPARQSHLGAAWISASCDHDSLALS